MGQAQLFRSSTALEISAGMACYRKAPEHFALSVFEKLPDGLRERFRIILRHMVATVAEAMHVICPVPPDGDRVNMKNGGSGSAVADAKRTRPDVDGLKRKAFEHAQPSFPTSLA